MKTDQVRELVLQSLEHELGGIKVYETALECAVHPGLKKEWAKYLDETRGHVTALEQACSALGVDPKHELPGRAVVRHLGPALVQAMKLAQAAGNPAAAELVACECVVLAGTRPPGLGADQEERRAPVRDAGEALSEAASKIEDQEDEHLYHSKGWCRELWVKSLGMTAVLPAPTSSMARVAASAPKPTAPWQSMRASHPGTAGSATAAP